MRKRSQEDPDKPEIQSKFDQLAWPPVILSSIDHTAQELLAQWALTESTRAGRRGMRLRKTPLSPPQIKVAAVAMLRNCMLRGHVPPKSLVDLLAQILVGTQADDVENKLCDLMGWGRLSPKQMEAIRFEREHPQASAREVAKAVNVDHKTILEWRKLLLYRFSLPFDDQRTWVNPPIEPETGE